jgi:hypothetical protein
VRPDLDHWLADPTICVPHRREAAVGQAELWEAARTVRVADTRVLGRLLRWRIPGVPKSIAYDELFRAPPFTVLREAEGALVSGLVGRIWTLRRDYPSLSGPDEFRRWSKSGTARVVFANWVEPAGPGHARLCSETRVGVSDREGVVGLAAVRPLISAFHSLVGREAIMVAVRRAEGAAAPPGSSR